MSDGTTSSATKGSALRRRRGPRRFDGFTRRSGVSRSKVDLKIGFQPAALGYQPFAEFVADGERGQGELDELRVGRNARPLLGGRNESLIQPGAQEVCLVAAQKVAGAGRLERELRPRGHQPLRTCGR